MKTLARLAVPTLCLVAAVACRERATERERERTGTAPGTEQQTTTTGAQLGMSNESAVDRIVSARCAREATCNNIGPDKNFTDRNACTQKLRADMKDDLSAKDCPRGIDSKELNECLEAIQKEDCNNPIDMIGRLAACRTSDLCLATDMPNR